MLSSLGGRWDRLALGFWGRYWDRLRDMTRRNTLSDDFYFVSYYDEEGMEEYPSRKQTKTPRGSNGRLEKFDAGHISRNLSRSWSAYVLDRDLDTRATISFQAICGCHVGQKPHSW